MSDDSGKEKMEHHTTDTQMNLSVPQGLPCYDDDFLYLGQNVDLFQEVFKLLGEVHLCGLKNPAVES